LKDQHALEKLIRKALNGACDIAKDEAKGFEWLTHIANHSTHPLSLSVTCVFDNSKNLSKALLHNQDDYIRNLIKNKLETVDIFIENVQSTISFDTE